MLMVFLMYAVSMIKEPGGNYDNFLLSFWVLKSRLLPVLRQNYPFGTHLFELRKYSRGGQFFTVDSKSGEAPGSEENTWCEF